ncbi:hypothetical protein M1N45_01435 [Dehalococcoidia bacterium]|nr:hypothetical protein [Dehalococcoidia bacterium]
MKLTLTRNPSDGESRHWSKPLLITAFVVAALSLLGFTFIYGGITYRDGLRPRDLTNWFKDEISRLTNYSSSLPTLTVDMGFNEWQKVSTIREEALDRGFLLTSDEEFVPATVTFDGRSVPVNIRLKGDSSTHWNTDKWSFRIHARGDERILGMKRFSIQTPPARTYHYDQGFLDNLRFDGVLAPQVHFVNVEINGKFLGVYNLEEQTSNEMIEASGRREGVILAMDQDPWWQYFERVPDVFGVGILPPGHQGIFAQLRIFQENRVAQDPVLLAQAQTAMDRFRGFQEGRLSASEVFDIELTAKYLAIVDLWAAEHGTAAPNIRWYYNPITTKLEPIGQNGAPHFNEFREAILSPFNWDSDHILRILDDNEMAAAFARQLDRVSQPSYLTQLKDAIGASNERSLVALQNEYSRDLRLFAPWDWLERRQIVLLNVMDPPLTAVAYGYTEEQETITPSSAEGLDFRLDVANLLALPLDVTGLEIQAPTFNDSDGSVAGSPEPFIQDLDGDSATLSRRVRGVYPRVEGIPDDPLEFTTINIKLDKAAADLIRNGGNVNLQTRMVGQDIVRRVPVTLLNLTNPGTQPLPSTPGLDEVLDTHPFLSFDAKTSVSRVEPGNWLVNGNLVIPSGFALEASAGTVLRFQSDALLSTTGPLRFVGNVDAPVELRAAGTSWAGVLVIGASATSIWDNVIVRDTSGPSAPGLGITGGATFYRSPVALRQVSFLGSTAEDALNVVFSSVAMDSVEFADTISDAFDGDSVTGTISSSRFRRVGGDAIDLSASQITGDGILFRNIGDKAISAGEATTARFTNSTITDASIGVASKDSSQVELENVTITRAQNVGLAAYQKKPEYDSAKIYGTRIQITGTDKPTLAQTGSYIVVDGRDVRPVDLDVKALYEAGFHGN